jgi:hypothetical protein
VAYLRDEMSRERETRKEGTTTGALAAWNLLAGGLRGGFEARARGLFAGEFALLGPDGEEFGRLGMRGLAGAALKAGGLEAEIERRGLFGARYTMTTDGAPLLLAGPERPHEPLRIFCGGEAFGAETSLLLNRATARPLSEGPKEAGGDLSLRGTLAGRKYRASFPEADGASLAVVAFLLYRTVALRRQAY